MGRMLETLKHGELRRGLPTAEKPAPEVPAQDCVVDWEIGEEVPFIEVGGPNKKVELSPGLLAHPAQVVPQRPHHAVEPAIVAPKPASVKLTPAVPMSVAYEAYPSTPTVSSAISAEIIAYHQPDHAASKQYANLLDTLLHGVKGPSVLLFVGVKPNVGASTVILNLATIAAQQKKLRVAVVEGNGKHAGLTQRMGHTNRAGLDDVLTGSLGLEQAMVRTAITPLHLLPAGAKQLAISDAAFAWLCTWLRDRYDLVLIDGPTLDEPAALTVQAPHAQAIYLVLPKGESMPDKSAAQSIHCLGGRLCGLIHTHVELG